MYGFTSVSETGSDARRSKARESRQPAPGASHGSAGWGPGLVGVTSEVRFRVRVFP